jgi:hypothetical protein
LRRWRPELSVSARREDGKVVDLPAGLTVFRMGADGKLTYARKYDINVPLPNGGSA